MQTSATETAAAPPPEPMCKVLDLTAKKDARIHDLWDRSVLRRYTFKPDEERELPMRVAAPLVANAGFRVTDDRGIVLRTVERTVNGERVSMRSDQVVARLDELTKEALIERVREAGGDPAKLRTKEELAAWLIRQLAADAEAQAEAAARKPGAVVAEDEAAEVEEAGDPYE